MLGHFSVCKTVSHTKRKFKHALGVPRVPSQTRSNEILERFSRTGLFLDQGTLKRSTWNQSLRNRGARDTSGLHPFLNWEVNQ